MSKPHFRKLKGSDLARGEVAIMPLTVDVFETTLPKDIDTKEAIKRFCRTDEAADNLTDYITQNYIPKSELLQIIKDSKPKEMTQDTAALGAGWMDEEYIAYNSAIDLFEQNLLNKLEEK